MAKVVTVNMATLDKGYCLLCSSKKIRKWITKRN